MAVRTTTNVTDKHLRELEVTRMSSADHQAKEEAGFAKVKNV
jgi:hypothetical protein